MLDVAKSRWNGLPKAELAISLLLLIAILALVDPIKVWEVIKRADPLLLLLGLAAYGLTVLIMSWRIRHILSHLGHRIPLRAAAEANLAGLLASDFTPARSGYFVVPFILERQARVPPGDGMAAIVGPQVFDFFLKAAGAAFAIVVLLSANPLLGGSSLLLFAGVGVMLAFSAGLAFLLFAPHALLLLKPFFALPFVKPLHDFLETLQARRKAVLPLLPLLGLLSICTFALKGLEWYLIGLSLGITFDAALHPFLVFLVLQPLITAFQFAPIPTIAGLGLSEGSAAASMVLLGVPVEVSVAYLLLVRALTTLFDGLGIGPLAALTASLRSKSS